MLVEFEGLTEAEALRFRLLFDARMLTARADEGPAATAAWDRLALSDDSYLRSNGFDVEAYPDEEERKRRMLEKVLMADPGDYGPIILPVLYPELGGMFGAKPAPTSSGPSAAPSPGVPSAPSRGEAPLGPPAVAPSGSAPTPAVPTSAAGVEPSEALVTELTREANAALMEVLRGVTDPGSARLGVSAVLGVEDWLRSAGVVDVVDRSLVAVAALSAMLSDDREFVSPDEVRQALVGVI